ncbi:hypothetical protein SAMN05660226_02135 [Parapedobacter luteus]|uniref:Uncharacterized protein n=2 Tax=Sphingobacteriaceae TaxID=84566 RepID=A0A1T5CDY6_9SPHI|nr:hypothetical protein SAMN05660226_02135 [Parapedobacter luteus]
MPIAMLNSYLTDFLFIPVVAHISLTTVRVLFKKGATYRYALLPLLVAASVTAGVMELALPKISADYVFDVGDIFAYFSGALFFYYVHQRHVY